jgi:integrase
MPPTNTKPQVKTFPPLVLSLQTLHRLTSDRAPKVDADGQLAPLKGGEHPLVPSKSGGAWTALLQVPASSLRDQRAPSGLGVYVGPRGATFVIQARIQGKVSRKTLKRCRDFNSFDEAVRAARAVVEGGVPDDVLARDPYEATLDHILTLWLASKGKQKNADATKKSNQSAYRRWSESRWSSEKLRVLTRPGVLTRAFDEIRIQSAVNSLLLPGPKVGESRLKKQNLKALGLSEEDMARPGASGFVVSHYIAKKQSTDFTEEEFGLLGLDDDAAKERVRQAGRTAAEDCFKVASSAVAWWLKQAAMEHVNKGLPMPVAVNPFTSDEAREGMRTLKERRESRKLTLRGRALSLDVQDAKNELHLFLDAVHKRREATKVEGWRRQGGLISEPGPDYLLTTLLLGARRSETARLVWFDRIPPGKTEESVSWVYLPDVMTQGRRPEMLRLAQVDLPLVHFHTTKSKRAHELPLGPALTALLRERFRNRDNYELAADRRHWVFPSYSPKSHSGHYVEPKTFLTSVKQGMSSVRRSLASLSPHDLRRTFITLGISSGADVINPFHVSSIVNHSQAALMGLSSVTEGYIAKHFKELVKPMAAMENVILGNHPQLLAALTQAHAKPSPRPRRAR